MTTGNVTADNKLLALSSGFASANRIDTIGYSAETSSHMQNFGATFLSHQAVYDTAPARPRPSLATESTDLCDWTGIRQL